MHITYSCKASAHACHGRMHGLAPSTAFCTNKFHVLHAPLKHTSPHLIGAAAVEVPHGTTPPLHPANSSPVAANCMHQHTSTSSAPLVPSTQHAPAASKPHWTAAAAVAKVTPNPSLQSHTCLGDCLAVSFGSWAPAAAGQLGGRHLPGSCSRPWPGSRA